MQENTYTITKIMDIQNNKDALKIFHEAVKLYGASNWAKVQEYLKLYNMDIQVQHIMRLWKNIQTDQIAQVERDKSLKKSIEQNLEYIDIDSKFDASKQIYKKLLALIRQLIQHFYRRKIAIREYLGPAGHGIRRQSFKRYLGTLELKTDNKLINEMKPYAQKFKELLLLTLDIEYDELSRQDRFSIYMNHTYKSEVNTMIDHLAHINEYYKIYDKTTIKDCQIKRFSSLTPATIQECINTEEYKILFNNSNTVAMFQKFIATQHDEIQERQSYEYSFNPFSDSLQMRGPVKIPKSVKSKSNTQKKKPRRRENVFSHSNTKAFHWDVIRDLKEDQDSMEYVVPEQINISQVNAEMVQAAIAKNTEFQRFYFSRLAEFQKQCFVEFTKNQSLNSNELIKFL